MIGFRVIPSVSWLWSEEAVEPFGIGAPLLVRFRQSNGVDRLSWGEFGRVTAWLAFGGEISAEVRDG